MVSTASSRRRTGSAGPTAGSPPSVRPISTATEPWTSPSSTARIWRRPSGSFRGATRRSPRSPARPAIRTTASARTSSRAASAIAAAVPRWSWRAATGPASSRFAGRGRASRRPPWRTRPLPPPSPPRWRAPDGCPSSWRKYLGGARRGGGETPFPAASPNRQCPPADIAPDMGTRKVDPVDEPVGPSGRIREGVAPRRHPEHPPARDDGPAIHLPRAGVKHHLSAVLGQVAQPGDHLSRLDGAGISGGGHHHAEGMVAGPVHPRLAETAFRAGLHRVEHLRAEPHHQHLGLGVAEAHVVFHEPRRAVLDHEPGVKHA